MDYIKMIIDTIDGISGRYSSHEIFNDWIKCGALTYSNQTDLIHGKIWHQREQQYIDTMKKYSKEERNKFVDMLGMLVLKLDEEITDVLGTVYMQGNMGSKSTGQFFTPFHLSLLCAAMTIPQDISPKNPFIINEPSTGGGGMILAAVRVLKDRGLNPRHCMKVVAQDLDWKGVYMTYLQLSVLGIKATVVQGDTLIEPFVRPRDYPPERVFYTPTRKGMIL